MKKSVLILICSLFLHNAFAQWVSPDEGRRYTMGMLAADSTAGVICDSAGCYVMAADITVSATDTLALEASAMRLAIGGAVLEIRGALVCEERDEALLITGDTAGDSRYTIRFDSAAATTLANIIFENGEKVQLAASDLRFSGCEFRNFRSDAISLLGSSPEVSDCHFHHNAAAAIGSAANMMSSPSIVSNTIYYNVTSGANKPQINLGPGAADTIVIEGNRIEGGASSMSGGIGVMNIYGYPTALRISGNLITGNRYGYTQNGIATSALITDNVIADNTLETNPNNGGSGISIYGNDTTCAAKVRNNIISGNLWGITAIYHHGLDLGTAEDPGGNVIYGNANGGVEYALYNNAYSDMPAIGNYWGSNDTAHAEEVIFHHVDNQGLGLVTFDPIMALEPQILTFEFLAEDNIDNLWQGGDHLCSSTIFSNDTIYIAIPPYEVNSCEALVPRITIPLGETCEPASGVAQNFGGMGGLPVYYTVSTPHGATREYVVIVSEGMGIPSEEGATAKIFPNPVREGVLNIERSEEGSATVLIHSSWGQMMFHRQVSERRVSVNTRSWRSGVYFVTVRQGGKAQTSKIIVE